MTDAGWPDERAGWWRRTVALTIDCLCVALPSTVLGALLFATTGGYLQWSGPGLQWQRCEAVTSIPANLDPPPPQNSNQAELCRAYSIAGPIGRTLIVARTVRENNSVTTVSRDYALRDSGQGGGHDLSWITWIALLILLIYGDWRFGTTPGKKLLGLRVIAVQDSQGRSVPLRQVATRYGVAIGAVLLPVGLGLAVVLIPVALGGTPPGVAFVFFALLMAASAAWQIWNMVRIVRRRPAVYDEIARVEVIRTRPRLDAAPSMPEEPGPV